MVEIEREPDGPEPDWDRLLGVAGELERWAANLPSWRPESLESWQEFSRRYHAQEVELTERLRRLPGCRVLRSAAGQALTLTLAGVSVRSHAGLDGACRDWVALVRRSSRGGAS